MLVSEQPGHKGTHLSAEDRLALARAAFPDDDVRLDPHPRTIDLLRAETFDDPLFIVGADEFCDFLSWKEPDAVLEGIRAAARGESPLAPKAARALLAERTGRASAPDLSEREQEVLALVGEGLPNKLIARKLDIYEKTVKAHLTRVFRELGVYDRTQAALWAREHLPKS